MNKRFHAIALLLLLATGCSSPAKTTANVPTVANNETIKAESPQKNKPDSKPKTKIKASLKKCHAPQILNAKEIYSDISTDEFVKFKVFKKAVDSYNKVRCKREGILGIVDYSKSSTKKRFFIIDIKARKLLLSTYVAHAKASGWEYAKHYSNDVDSSMSTYGVLQTGFLYYGKNGLSLKMNGLEKNINDNTFKRHIVIHGAKYVGKNWMSTHGDIQGRSLGCFAIPTYEYKPILPKISEGTVFYVNPIFSNR